MKVTIKAFFIFSLFVLLLIAGCSGSNGKTGATGPQGAQGITGPTMPIIQSLNATGLPAIPGSPVTTTVIAQSAQNLALTYTWTATSLWSVSPSSVNSQTATIIAPSGYGMTGTATIEVSDINGMYAIGVIALSTQGDSAPVINSITALPNPVSPNGVITAVVNTYDAQGNIPNYIWEASSGWAITGYGTTATVIAPSTYNTGGYITVTVSDNYGYEVTGTIGVSTLDVIPSTPTDLTALSRISSILLAWNASTGATSYTIYESAVSGGPYMAVGTTTTTAYTVTGITNSTPYYFVVSAQNNAAESGYSNQVKGSKLVTSTYAVGLYPYSIAIDASGNVWVTNYADSTVTELSPTGATKGTYHVGFNPEGIAIDASGDVWVTNWYDSTVTELSPTGTTKGTYAVGSYPMGIAIDASSNVWVANSVSNTVSALCPTGTTITTVTVGGNPDVIAIDASGDVWVANHGSNTVTELSFTGTTLKTYNVGNSDNYHYGIAIDPSGNLWVANVVYNTVTALSPTGVTLGTYNVGTSPMGIAIDASGNVWVVNSNSKNVTELSPTGTTKGTYAVGSNPMGIAIDASGNVWVANYGSGNVTELKGITTGPQYFPYIGPQFPGGGNF